MSVHKSKPTINDVEEYCVHRLSESRFCDKTMANITDPLFDDCVKDEYDQNGRRSRVDGMV